MISPPADPATPRRTEPQRQLRSLRDSDPWTACHIRARRAAGNPQPRSTRQIPRVQRPVDVARLAQSPRSACQILQPLDPPPSPHHIHSVQRLKRADQHRTPDAAGLGDRVQAEPRMNRVDVCMSRRAEHRRIPPRRTAKRMTRRIVVGEIRLGLDNPPDHQSAACAPDHQLPQQLAGHRWDVAQVERTRQRRSKRSDLGRRHDQSTRRPRDSSHRFRSPICVSNTSWS